LRWSHKFPAGRASRAQLDVPTYVQMFNSSAFIPTTVLYKDSLSTLLGGFISMHLATPKYCASLTTSRLPENVSYAQGALLEPLSVVMSSLSRTRLSLGRGAVICGAGPIGLITLAAARASGAHPLVITDLEPKRLTFAKDFVPSCQVYQVDPALNTQGNAKAIRALFGSTEYEAPEAVLECTGVESSVITASYTVRRGGDLVVIGVGRNIMNNLPFMHLSLSEV
jgi:L-iditol 2-dehydrogenase